MELPTARRVRSRHPRVQRSLVDAHLRTSAQSTTPTPALTGRSDPQQQNYVGVIRSVKCPKDDASHNREPTRSVPEEEPMILVQRWSTTGHLVAASAPEAGPVHPK
jgi:hypothetical protein